MATVDLRSNFLAVRHQGRRQTCLAIAASAAHEYCSQIEEQLSVEYLFFQAVTRTADADPDAGTTMAATAAAVADEGQPVETAWPYLPTQLYVPHWAPPAITKELYKTVMTVGAPDFRNIARTLEAGRPTILGLVITDAFYRPNPHGVIDDHNPGVERGGHAVLAVGHGLDERGGRYLLVRNSWGPTWGLDGHAWLPEDYLDRQLHETAFLT